MNLTVFYLEVVMEIVRVLCLEADLVIGMVL